MSFKIIKELIFSPLIIRFGVIILIILVRLFLLPRFGKYWLWFFLIFLLFDINYFGIYLISGISIEIIKKYYYLGPEYLAKIIITFSGIGLIISSYFLDLKIDHQHILYFGIIGAFFSKFYDIVGDFLIKIQKDGEEGEQFMDEEITGDVLNDILVKFLAIYYFLVRGLSKNFSIIFIIILISWSNKKIRSWIGYAIPFVYYIYSDKEIFGMLLLILFEIIKKSYSEYISFIGKELAQIYQFKSLRETMGKIGIFIIPLFLFYLKELLPNNFNNLEFISSELFRFFFLINFYDYLGDFEGVISDIIQPFFHGKKKEQIKKKDNEGNIRKSTNKTSLLVALSIISQKEGLMRYFMVPLSFFNFSFIIFIFLVSVGVSIYRSIKVPSTELILFLKGLIWILFFGKIIFIEMGKIYLPVFLGILVNFVGSLFDIAKKNLEIDGIKNQRAISFDLIGDFLKDFLYNFFLIF